MASDKLQEFQKTLDAKGYGHLGLGIASSLMFFVFCPMSIVAVAATYWTYSMDQHGGTVSAKASLWDVTVSSELQGSSSEATVSLCSDEMPDFDDCGKIHAVRFFVITALLLSLSSALFLMTSFSPKLKPTATRPTRRRKFSIAGVSLAAVALVWDFLGVMLASTIDMTSGYSLNGAGFVFLVLEIFFITLAIVLAVRATKAQSAQPQAAKQTEEVMRELSTAPKAGSPTPTLLAAVGASAESRAETKANIQVLPAQKKETE